MKKHILWVFATILVSSIYAQTDLETAEVEAFRLKSPEKLVTGVIYTVDSAVIKSHGSSDLSRALNFIPGVKMDTRGEGGSRRIHVRGSSLRSPYSIRNSMLIIDGFVFTEADGNSPVEWLDPEFISSINVVSGPAAASYGGAYGGALIAESTNPTKAGSFADCQFRISTTGRAESHSNYHPTFRMSGNIGLQSRLAYSSNFYSDDFTYSLSIITSENPGYRDWEWNIKDQLYFKSKSIDENNGLHTLIGGIYMGNWALPGALKEDSVISNPTYSPGLNYNAQVNRERFIVGYGYEKITSNNTEFNASILGRYTTKLNPYGTSFGYNGYKEERGFGLSALASIIKTKNLNEHWDLQGEITLMHINDNNVLEEWESAPSQITVAVPQRYDLDFNAAQTFASSSLILTNNDNLRLEAQLGVNHRNRETDGIIFQDEIIIQEEDTISFTNEIAYNVPKNHTTLLPRFGFSYMPTSSTSIFGQISTGFSDPTAFELVDIETLEPAELESENSVGQEFGIKLFLRNNVEFKATAYNQRVKNAIMHVTQENDAIAFENVSGGLLMRGVECEASWSNDILKLRGFATLTNHRFGSDSEFENNVIPGVPVISGGVQGKVKFDNVSIYSDFRHVGETIIDNENDIVADPYSVLDLSLECSFLFDLFIEIGCRNLLNAEYSNWLRINGGYGKYFNPAPPRTGFISIRRAI